MLWPSPKDFNDAIRNPSAAFTHPDLAACDPVVGANGRPTPHTGESSSVYQLCAEDGRSWAVKCFTRLYDQRGARYAIVREVLDPGVTPFAVAFEYLEGAMKVGGKRWPVLKMDWVEGLRLNHVARDRADSPAVMSGLLTQWVKLASALRAAGMAHGDLQHGNVILVPGRWPGSYTLKLVDYDGIYLPALAHSPSYETGHPNYQHPDRNERSYSPDLDRFPLLVVATALKGLAVRGPDLWKRFGGDDNMLFTAKDFRDPSASKLMQKMWRSKDATLRALVGNLALACLKPMAQTPWLDDLVREGSEPRLTDETTRAVQAVLGSSSRAVVALSEAFTLDDEPAKTAAPVLIPAEVVDPIEEPPPEPALIQAEVVEAAEAPEPTPAPRARPKAMKPLTPVPVLTEDEDEEDEPRPRGRARRREPESRPFPWVALAIVAGLMLVAGAVIAGVIVARYDKPDETQPPRQDEPPPVVDPTPPKPEPKPEPKEPEPVAGPPGFHKQWAKLIADERVNVNMHYHPSGQTLYLAMGGRIEALDAKTGNARVQFRGPSLPLVALHMCPLDRDRLAVFGFPNKAPAFWDAKTGDPLPSPLTRDPLPPPPPGVAPTAIECHLSPDGRYVFAGYQAPFRGPLPGAAPYRVVEVASGKVVAQGDWTFGAVRFTADGARMLMTETNGRVRWVKTETGETEIEWAFQPNPFPRMISGMSDDGALFVYHGRPGTLPQDNYLMDGKTGQVLRRLGPSFPGDRIVLSADGRWLAGVGTEPPNFAQVVALVADARSGEVVVRTPIEGEMRGIMRAAFTPDGRAFVLHNRQTHELVAYELRGALKPVEGAAIPPPLTLIPDRAPPGGGAAIAPAPPVVPPVAPPVVAPKGGLPEAPALKALWTVVTDTGAMVNQLSQAPLYSRDGATMILSGGNTGTILTFDPKTGAAGAVFDGHKNPAGVYWLVPFRGDRVVSGGFDARQTTWDTKTGKPVEDVPFPNLPPPPAGKGHAGITRAVSPGGRFTLAARRESGRPVPGPLRVLDTTTGKEIVSAEWHGGFASFTADESRLFVIDGLGKATWYKLPSGETDVEWRTGERVPTTPPHVLGITADGRTILYHGPLADQPTGVYLLEGNTGKVIRKLNPGAPYQASISTLSPDGKHVAMGVIDFNGFVWHVDVFEVATWRLVGRASPPEKNAREHPYFAFSPDGKELAVFYRTAKQMSVLPLPAE